MYNGGVMRRFKTSLFIFRHDLRLSDNTGLLAALEASERVIPAFIFDPRLIDPERDRHFNRRAFAFTLGSLEELSVALEEKGSKLYSFVGQAHDVVAELITRDAVQAVFVNAGGTRFVRQCDSFVEKACAARGATFFSYDDTTLAPIERVLTREGKPYSVFTPFLRRAREHTVPTPRVNRHMHYVHGKLHSRTVSLDEFRIHADQLPTTHPGRRAGKGLLCDLPLLLADYPKTRDMPALEGTSMLSPHHAAGTVSVRETYHAAHLYAGSGSEHYVNELYWRDFYYHIAHFFPHVFGKSFLSWGDHVPWLNDKRAFAMWSRGETGIPFVDAGMRQLNDTGWMHNRARMVVASFLTKNLLINWQWGERYFAERLVDHDPVVNNGSWQWAASVGADPRPVRIFNPYTQAMRYDPAAEYVRHWVPELRDVEQRLLSGGKARDLSQHAHGYPPPCIDVRESFHRARATYTEAMRVARKVKRG